MNFKKGFVDRFSKVVLSISVFVLCSALFVFSISGASASNDTEFNFPNEISNSDIATLQSSTSSGGRYQMNLSAVVDEDGATHWYILVWDTQTGRSKY